MKALSVRLPWAGLIASGHKTIETRTRRTSYRGDLLICASKRPDGPGAGHALCIVRLVDCRPMRKTDEAAANCSVYPGAWAWVLEDIRPIQPFQVRGQIYMFNVTLPQESSLPAEALLRCRRTQSPPLID